MYTGEVNFMEVAQSMDQKGFEFLRPIAWLADRGSGEILQADALFARRREIA